MDIALGTPPEEITEPFTIMLWGIVSESITTWLEALSSEQKIDKLIKGHPASSGVVEGIARVILSVEELQEIKQDERMK